MTYVLIVFGAMSISLAVVPLMVRLAPRLGMIDKPDARKVHTTPIARVGGWGIFIGALLPILYVAGDERLIHAYVIGALVLFVFGTWDDRMEVSHWSKFVGQFIAVGVLVGYGDLYVTSLPFLGVDNLSPVIGIPFTVIAMVGVINALNHSDGLDGLAAGESLLSIGAMALLSWIAGGHLALVVAFATIGGILGFLRYNTHPATVFMGDGGSQFLGYTVGFLAVLLTQQLDTSLNSAVVLLLIGLPVVDILVVLKKRIQGGGSWFLATRNHVHHRFLDLGFAHRESVVIIYSVQTLLVASGLLLRNQNEWLILTCYLAMLASLFIPLNLAERSGWRADKDKDAENIHNTLSRARRTLLVIAPRRYLEFAVPAYLIFGSFLVREVPVDVALGAALIFVLLVIEPLFIGTTRSVVRRSLIFVLASVVVFLQLDFPRIVGPWLAEFKAVYFFLMALSVAVAVRFNPGRRSVEFQTTAMDYLMVFIMVTGLVYSLIFGGYESTGVLIVKLIVLWYACELLIIEKRERWNVLTVSALAAAGILAIKGLLPLI
ncbi:MAG: MraY family glycosyltransferase [Pseudomonadota bacterium]|nr:MraY family glycosyltransferase [Pseudomonadota bacterium]